MPRRGTGRAVRGKQGLPPCCVNKRQRTASSKASALAPVVCLWMFVGNASDPIAGVGSLRVICTGLCTTRRSHSDLDAPECTVGSSDEADCCGH